MEILESIRELPGEAVNHEISEDTQQDTQRLMLRKGEGKKSQH